MIPTISDLPPADGWTTDDLEALPEDNVRRELLDGVLLVRPCPTVVHQVTAIRIFAALDESCPADFQVAPGVEVRISKRQSFTPDVVVATDEAARRRVHHYAPHEVRLAVEVVSPTSIVMDTITKPALYAVAGIPNYWRVETTSGIIVHTYKIDPAARIYRSSGTFDVELDTAEPWPVKIPIARLRPRHL